MAPFVYPIALGLALVGGAIWLLATWGAWWGGEHADAILLAAPWVVTAAVLAGARLLRRSGRHWTAIALLTLVALPTMFVVALLDTIAISAISHAPRDFVEAIASGAPLFWTVIGGVFALLVGSAIALWRSGRRQEAIMMFAVAAGLLLFFFGVLGMAFAFRFAP